MSLIVPSVSTRVDFFLPRIVGQLEKQIGDDGRVELLVLLDNRRWSIGRKMNELVRMARGRYIAGLGDDDEVTEDYVSEILRAIETNPGVDCITFDHEYWHDGELIAVISEGKDLVETNNYQAKTFTRTPDTKMPIRADIVKQFTYPHTWHGEDTQFQRWVSGKIETEYPIQKVLYRYWYRTDNPEGKHFRKDRQFRGFN